MQRLLKSLLVAAVLILPAGVMVACGGDGTETGHINSIVVKDGGCQVELWEKGVNPVSDWVHVSPDSLACQLQASDRAYRRDGTTVWLTFKGIDYTDKREPGEGEYACQVVRHFKGIEATQVVQRIEAKDKAECDQIPASHADKSDITVEEEVLH